MSKFTPTQLVIGKKMLLENCIIKSCYLVSLETNYISELSGSTISSMEGKGLIMETTKGTVLSPLGITEILKDLSPEELETYNKLEETSTEPTIGGTPSWEGASISYRDRDNEIKVFTLTKDYLQELLITYKKRYLEVI